MPEPLHYIRWASGDVLMTRRDAAGKSDIRLGTDGPAIWACYLPDRLTWKITQGLLFAIATFTFAAAFRTHGRLGSAAGLAAIIVALLLYSTAILKFFFLPTVRFQRVTNPDRPDGELWHIDYEHRRERDTLFVSRGIPVRGHNVWLQSGATGRHRIANLRLGSQWQPTAAPRWIWRESALPELRITSTQTIDGLPPITELKTTNSDEVLLRIVRRGSERQLIATSDTPPPLSQDQLAALLVATP